MTYTPFFSHIPSKLASARANRGLLKSKPPNASVSLDLMIRALLAVGASNKDIAHALEKS